MLFAMLICCQPLRRMVACPNPINNNVVTMTSANNDGPTLWIMNAQAPITFEVKRYYSYRKNDNSYTLIQYPQF